MTSTRIPADAKTNDRKGTSSTPTSSGRETERGTGRGTGSGSGRPRRDAPRGDESRTAASRSGRAGQNAARAQRSAAGAPRRQAANGNKPARTESSTRERSGPPRAKRPVVPAEPSGEELRATLVTDDEQSGESASSTAAAGERRSTAPLARTLLTGKGLAITVLSLVLAAAVTVSVLLWAKVNDVRHERDVARAADLSPTVQNQILERASKIAVDLTTYDYRSLAAQQQTLTAESTPAFQARFAQSKETLSTLFTSLDAVAKGTVADAAVKSTAGDTAVVLLFVNQSASSNKTKTPQSQYTRVRMTLKLVDGVWKLNQVDVV